MCLFAGGTQVLHLIVKGAAAGVTSDLRGCVQVFGHLLDLLKDTVGTVGH